MATIKGLVVQIGGDTSGLEKAIKSASKGATSLQKELNDINRQLKFDPKNVTMLAQKQQVVSEKIRETTNLLTALKEEQARYIKEGGDLNSPKYRELGRQIEQTTNELKKLNKENNQWIQASNNLQKFSDTLGNIGSKLTEIGSSLTRNVTVPIAGLVTAGVALNTELEKNTKIFELFTDSTEDAQNALNNLRKDAQTSVFSSKDLISANRYLLSAGLSADEAREDINNLANALAAVGGDASMLNNMAYNLAQVRGNSKAAAIDMRQFANTGIPIWQILQDSTGKTRAELEDVGVTYDMLTKALKDAASEGGRLQGAMESLADTTSGKFTQMKGKLEESLMGLTTSLMPIIIKVLDKITGLIDKFNNLDQGTKDIILKIGLAAAAAGPLLTIIGKVATGIATVSGWLSKAAAAIGQASAGTGGLSTALSTLTGPVGIVIAVVGALTAAFVHLFKTNEEFKEKVQETWNNVVAFFQEKIMPIINEVVTFVKNVIDTIWSFIQTAWETIEPFIAEMFTELMDWWNTTGNEIFSVVAEVLKWLFEKVNWLWVNVIDPIIKLITENLKPAISFFANGVVATIKFILQTITDYWNMIKGIFMGVIDFIAGVFTGDWERAWNGIKNIFSSIVNGLVNTFKTPLNYIIDLINGFIKGINKIKMPDWVPRNGRDEFQHSTNSKTSQRRNSRLRHISNDWRRQVTRGSNTIRQNTNEIPSRGTKRNQRSTASSREFLSTANDHRRNG